jgi:hypothetical protein
VLPQYRTPSLITDRHNIFDRKTLPTLLCVIKLPNFRLCWIINSLHYVQSFLRPMETVSQPSINFSIAIQVDVPSKPITIAGISFQINRQFELLFHPSSISSFHFWHQDTTYLMNDTINGHCIGRFNRNTIIQSDHTHIDRKSNILSLYGCQLKPIFN